MERISQYIQQLGGQPHHSWMRSTLVSHNCSYSTTVFSLMGAHCWDCSARPIRVNILDRMEIQFDEFSLVEFISYSLYLSNSHHDQPLLIFGKIKSLQLFPDVVFHVVFGFWDIVSVRPSLRLFYLVDETKALAYDFTLAHIFKFTTTCHF